MLYSNQSPALGTSDIWIFQIFLTLSGSPPKNLFSSREGFRKGRCLEVCSLSTKCRHTVAARHQHPHGSCSLPTQCSLFGPICSDSCEMQVACLLSKGHRVLVFLSPVFYRCSEFGFESLRIYHGLEFNSGDENSWVLHFFISKRCCR